MISSSSGWAHSVRTAPESFHAVYCYTPARWLYGGDHLGASRRKQALTPAIGLVRRWDRAAARRADLYIAISNVVRDRIKQRTASTRRSSTRRSTSIASRRASAASACSSCRGCCPTSAST